MIDGLRRCYKCGYETNEAFGECPRCRVRMLSAKQVRRRGWALLLIGLFLVALVGTITFNLAPKMLQPGVPAADGSRFTGTEQQAQLALGLFGLLIMVGLMSIVSGVWQIKTGRQNKWIMYIALGLSILLALIGKLIISQGK